MIDKSGYDSNGFTIVRKLFNDAEITLLGETISNDDKLKQAHTMPLDENNTNEPRFSLWYDLHDDLYQKFICNEKIIDVVEALVGEPCYHYHSKIVYKEPHVGGSWRWHQDYGYWYYYGFLFPKLVSCMIAIDDATVENGCLQVFQGSHTLGRLEHEATGKQMSLDEKRLQAVAQHFDKVDLVLAKGDVVFFHCNLLHHSAQNTSANARRAMITCFNATSNAPYSGYDIGKPHLQDRQPTSTVTNKVPANAIIQLLTSTA